MIALEIETTAAMLRMGLVFLVTLACVGRVEADVVSLKDGRTLEGAVVHESASSVKFDARVGSMRAVLSIKRSQHRVAGA
jgi:hypothetical protein